MAFSYTQIRSQQLDTTNYLIVRGYNTGSGVECNIYIKNNMTIETGNQKTKVSAESSHSNFFIGGATVASLTSDLPSQASYPLYQQVPFKTLYSLFTDDGKNTKKYITAASVTQGVIFCTYSKTKVKDVPEIAFNVEAYLIPGASISGTDITGGAGSGVLHESQHTAAVGSNSFTLPATPAVNSNMLSGRNVVGVYRNGLRSIYVSSPTLATHYNMPTSGQVGVVAQTGGEVFVIVIMA